MHSAGMGVDAGSNEAGLITNWSPIRQPSVKCFRLSQLRKLRGCDQVAAVCYRVRSSGIEFLLVRTNSGHWTFPKGNAEPGLTHAQAAALEAYEEAGVHGRMEESSFATYVRRKRGDLRNSGRSASARKELAVQAHLCEVSRLDPPQERDRHPTWFSVDKAKRRLREDRTADFAAELARVIDRAVSRIQRRSKIPAAANQLQKDALQKVQFIDSIVPITGPGKAPLIG
jgi:8-oxo-dGTP pyrophosphatase MutT (NUDIX family)